MDIKEREALDSAVLVLKQASLARTILYANASFERGEVKEISPPPGATAHPVSELRVKAQT